MGEYKSVKRKDGDGYDLSLVLRTPFGDEVHMMGRHFKHKKQADYAAELWNREVGTIA